jgi:uncharacterized membrane protein YoaK (UPF0700 family)
VTNSTASGARRVAMVLLLAIVGGGVDAVLVLRLGVLVGAQTGNTIFLAVALSQRHAASALLSVLSLVGFVVGVAIGEVIMVVRGLPDAALRRVACALGIELITLGALVALWRTAGPQPTSRESFYLAALAAAAMGMQTAAALRLNVGPITTYITGSLTNFTIDVIRPLQDADASTRQAGLLSGNRPFIYAITWLFYFAGALATGMIDLATSTNALVLPIAVIVIAVDVAVR